MYPPLILRLIKLAKLHLHIFIRSSYARIFEIKTVLSNADIITPSEARSNSQFCTSHCREKKKCYTMFLVASQLTPLKVNSIRFPCCHGLRYSLLVTLNVMALLLFGICNHNLCFMTQALLPSNHFHPGPHKQASSVSLSPRVFFLIFGVAVYTLQLCCIVRVIILQCYIALCTGKALN